MAFLIKKELKKIKRKKGFRVIFPNCHWQQEFDRPCWEESGFSLQCSKAGSPTLSGKSKEVTNVLISAYSSRNTNKSRWTLTQQVCVSVSPETKKLRNNNSISFKRQAVAKCTYIMNYTWRKLPGKRLANTTTARCDLRKDWRVGSSSHGGKTSPQAPGGSNFAAANSFFKLLLFILNSCHFAPTLLCQFVNF